MRTSKHTRDKFSSEDLINIHESWEEVKAGAIRYEGPQEILLFIIGDDRYSIPTRKAALDALDDLRGPRVCSINTSEYHPKHAEWHFGMTTRFVKDIEKYDRKIQGRILLTISDITRNPTTPRGDTIKPLTAELKGLWRYRIGDFRLVYLPDPEKSIVTLIAFTGRGDIYESLQLD